MSEKTATYKLTVILKKPRDQDFMLSWIDDAMENVGWCTIRIFLTEEQEAGQG